jgi:hypothetical protein
VIAGSNLGQAAVGEPVDFDEFPRGTGLDQLMISLREGVRPCEPAAALDAVPSQWCARGTAAVRGRQRHGAALIHAEAPTHSY